MGAQSLLCKLMGHLVQKYFHHRIPGVVKHEIPAQGDFAPFPGPCTPRSPVIAQTEERRTHPLPVFFIQDPQGCFPFKGKPLQDAMFQRCLAMGALH
jgi:hypothetical protein